MLWRYIKGLWLGLQTNVIRKNEDLFYHDSRPCMRFLDDDGEHSNVKNDNLRNIQTTGNKSERKKQGTSIAEEQKTCAPS